MTRPAKAGTWPDSYVAAFMRGAASERDAEERRSARAYAAGECDWTRVALNVHKLKEIEG